MEDRELFWVKCKKDLEEFPKPVKDAVIFALEIAKGGGKHQSAKPLQGFHGASVLEIVQRGKDTTFRAVYTVKFKEFVYVLHCFKKKSKSGIKTPQKDLDLIENRLKQAEIEYKQFLKDKKNEIKRH